MDLKLRPFNVPDFVIQEISPRMRQEGWGEAPRYRLSEVDADTLASMCSEFRSAVFAEAGKEDPAAQGRGGE